MRVAFTDDGLAHFCSSSDDGKIMSRINRLVYTVDGDNIVII